MALFASKLEYAVTALIAIAVRPGSTPVQSGEIAEQQGLSGPYLDQVLAGLRRAGLVRSIRGASGGYLLGTSPGRITVAAILEAVHGRPYLLPAESEVAGPVTGQKAVYWAMIRRMETEFGAMVAATTLQDLIDDLVSRDDALSVANGI